MPSRAMPSAPDLDDFAVDDEELHHPGRPQWRLTLETEFINSLGTGSGKYFPKFEDDIDRGTMREACNWGFYFVKNRFDRMRWNGLNTRTMDDIRLCAVIEAKTLGFGKFFEKIDRKIFREGQKDIDGQKDIIIGYKMHSGNVSRARSRLAEAGLITVIEDFSDNYKDGAIYCLGDTSELINQFMKGAGYYFDKKFRPGGVVDLDFSSAYYEELRDVITKGAGRLWTNKA